MEYGGIPRDEMEVTIRLDRETGQAHICSTRPEWSRPLGKLYGPPRRVTERGGKVASAFWTVRASLVTLRRGMRRLSDAQRQAAGDRLREARNRPSVPAGLPEPPHSLPLDATLTSC